MIEEIVNSTSYALFQIEDSLQRSVLGSGIGRATSTGCNVVCECCCSPRVLISNGSYMIQSVKNTFVGPALSIAANCKCITEKQENQPALDIKEYYSPRVSGNELEKFPEDRKIKTQEPSNVTEDLEKQFPFAYAMRNKKINGKLTECRPDTCLNGGRCIPSTPGFK